MDEFPACFDSYNDYVSFVDIWLYRDPCDPDGESPPLFSDDSVDLIT